MELLLDALRILNLNDSQLLINHNHKDVTLKTKNGQELKCFIPAAMYVGQLSSRKGFVGDTKEEQASVYQWLEYCLLHRHVKDSKEMLIELNLFLGDKVYFVSKHFTIVDLLLYLSLHDIYSKMTFQEKEIYCNLSRWFRQVQNDACAHELYPKICFTKTRLYT